MILDLIGNTPLLELRRVSRALGRPGVRFHAKAEFFNPGGSVKDRPARHMILEAIRRGDLTPQKTILDSSSGNTGVAYAMIAASLGYRLELVMPENVSDKKRIIESYGAGVILTDPLEGSDGAIQEAHRRRKANPDLYYMPDQYNNPDNWKAHYLTTGEEIWRQTGGKLTHFLAAIGTGGTLMGCGRRLREFNSRVQIVEVEPATELHGLEGMKHMASSIVPAIYEPGFADRKVSVFTEDAYEMCCRLAREEGILAGFSSGAVLHAAFEVAADLEEAEIVMVFADAGDRYLRSPYWDELLKQFEQWRREHPEPPPMPPRIVQAISS